MKLISSTKAKCHNKSKKLLGNPKRYPKFDIDLRKSEIFRISNIYNKHSAASFYIQNVLSEIRNTFGYIFQISESIFGYLMTPRL